MNCCSFTKQAGKPSLEGVAQRRINPAGPGLSTTPSKPFSCEQCTAHRECLPQLNMALRSPYDLSDLAFETDGLGTLSSEEQVGCVCVCVCGGGSTSTRSTQMRVASLCIVSPVAQSGGAMRIFAHTLQGCAEPPRWVGLPPGSVRGGHLRSEKPTPRLIFHIIFCPSSYLKTQIGKR